MGHCFLLGWGVGGGGWGDVGSGIYWGLKGGVFIGGREGWFGCGFMGSGFGGFYVDWS